MTDKEVMVLYHANCSDGFGAAYAAWVKFGDTAEYIPVNYGHEPPDVTGKQVYILDFSYKRDVLREMHKKADFLLVLDHHKSAQEDLAGLDFAVFDMNRSGCVLAWEYFHLRNPPYGLMLIQDRDLWKFDLEETKAFNAGLRAFVPQTFIDWHAVMHCDDTGYSLATEGLALRGGDILEVFNKDIEDLAKRKHEIVLAGKIGVGCNATAKYASELGSTLAKTGESFAVVYSYDGHRDEWQYSLRSVGEYDVTVIAKHYGGGGHKNAAGFATKLLTGFNRTEYDV